MGNFHLSIYVFQYYKESAKHPFATTMAEEIFQTGIVPSDTDFVIFTDYGDIVGKEQYLNILIWISADEYIIFHITGYDIGLVCNGFVYHTKYDQYDIIPRASIQNTGDNLLALAKALANAPELADTTVRLLNLT